jgi:hypothetical protein
MFARKHAMDGMPCAEETAKVAEWTKSWEYREKNLAREALTINPVKACQPLGAVFAAAGFEKTLSFVHGSQGCVAYYRSHLSRHFKPNFHSLRLARLENPRNIAVFACLAKIVVLNAELSQSGSSTKTLTRADSLWCHLGEPRQQPCSSVSRRLAATNIFTSSRTSARAVATSSASSRRSAGATRLRPPACSMA